MSHVHAVRLVRQATHILVAINNEGIERRTTVGQLSHEQRAMIENPGYNDLSMKQRLERFQAIKRLKVEAEYVGADQLSLNDVQDAIQWMIVCQNNRLFVEYGII